MIWRVQTSILDRGRILGEIQIEGKRSRCVEMRTCWSWNVVMPSLAILHEVLDLRSITDWRRCSRRFWNVRILCRCRSIHCRPPLHNFALCSWSLIVWHKPNSPSADTVFFAIHPSQQVANESSAPADASICLTCRINVNIVDGSCRDMELSAQQSLIEWRSDLEADRIVAISSTLRIATWMMIGDWEDAGLLDMIVLKHWKSPRLVRTLMVGCRKHVNPKETLGDLQSLNGLIQSKVSIKCL